MKILMDARSISGSDVFAHDSSRELKGKLSRNGDLGMVVPSCELHASLSKWKNCNRALMIADTLGKAFELHC